MAAVGVSACPVAGRRARASAGSCVPCRAVLTPRADSASTSGRSDARELFKAFLAPLQRPAVWTAQQVGMAMAASGMAMAFAFSQPAAAVTNEQLIFLEAWRAVDRAFYDKSFNGQSWFRIREGYLKKEPMSEREETYAAIRKALAKLEDPFTRFLEPARYQALKRGNAGGGVTGVGLEVGFDSDDPKNGHLIVVAPSANGPAERGGVKPLDRVLAIGGKSTQGMSLYEAGDLLQGADGSEVVLRLQPHAGDNKPLDVPLKRERIQFDAVTRQLCRPLDRGAPILQASTSSAQSPSDGSEPRVGYIRVATFSQATGEGVKSAIRQLKKDGADRYVLDIRNNGGGLFPAGVDVARMWLDSGDIVLIADSLGVRDTYEATGIALEGSAPLAVLVNHGTASASEVLAGALQDNKRATIVGETTFGKGLIQTIVELSDGSAVVVTVARYQTPAGTDINKVGISPDVRIATTEMPPMDGAGFCSYAGTKQAPPMFAKAKPPRKGVSIALAPPVNGRSKPAV